MDPFQRFQHCLRILEQFFKYVGQNIFDKSYNYYTFGSLFYLIFQIGSVISYVHTVIAFDRAIAYTAVLIIPGICQVKAFRHLMNRLSNIFQKINKLFILF